MATRQVLQATADQDPAVLPRFVGIGEVHLLLQQERAQMFVDLLQRGVFEGFVGTFLRLSLLDFITGGPVLHELDAGELFQDPALRRVERKLGLFCVQSLIHCHHAIELFDIGAGVKRYPFNQLQNRGGAIAWWRGNYPGNLPFTLHGRTCEASLFPHQSSSPFGSLSASLCRSRFRWTRSNSALLPEPRFGSLFTAPLSVVR